MKQEEIQKQALVLQVSLEQFLMQIQSKIDELEHMISTITDDSKRTRYKRNIMALDNMIHIIKSHIKMCQSLPEDIATSIRMMGW